MIITTFKLSVLSIYLALVIPTISHAVADARKDKNEVIDTDYTLSNGIEKNEVIAFQRDIKRRDDANWAFCDCR